MTLRRSVLAIFVAMLLAVLVPAFVCVPALGATAFTVSGTRALHNPPYPEQLLPAYFSGDTISQVQYPAAVFRMDRSIAIAVAGLTTGVLTTPGQVVAAGFSQGALAVAHAKKDLMALPADRRPAADQLSFLTIGDPAGPGGILNFLRFRIPVIGLTPFSPPDTPYDTVIVNGQYDGWGDFPDRPWNLLSVANALLGIIYVHGRYETIPGGLDVSIVPPVNITTTVNGLGGSTTKYLIPTGKLPLLQPLRDIGVPGPIVTALEKPLKKAVDKGYARNDAARPKPVGSTTVRTAPRQVRQPERGPAGQPHRRSPGRAVA